MCRLILTFYSFSVNLLIVVSEGAEDGTRQPPQGTVRALPSSCCIMSPCVLYYFVLYHALHFSPSFACLLFALAFICFVRLIVALFLLFCRDSRRKVQCVLCRVVLCRVVPYCFVPSHTLHFSPSFACVLFTLAFICVVRCLIVALLLFCRVDDVPSCLVFVVVLASCRCCRVLFGHSEFKRIYTY